MTPISLLAVLLGLGFAAPTPPAKIVAIDAPAPTQQLQISGGAKVGQMAPWFAGWTPEDQVLNRTQLLKHPAKGHALLFFATWCKPCEAGLTQVAARHAALKAAGVNVVLVAVGQRRAEVRPWLKARGLDDLPLMLDRFGAVAQAFGAQTLKDGKATTQLPRTVILAPDGEVRAILGHEGPDFLPLIETLGTAP